MGMTSPPDPIREVNEKIRHRAQIYFAKDSGYLQDLAMLIEGQGHRALVLWALGHAGRIAGQLTARYPQEDRPAMAVRAAWAWARGAIRMRQAQRAILDAHAVAKQLDDPRDIALCHALGQACSVVHTPKHAMGLPMYELTAIVHEAGLQQCADALAARKADYIDTLLICAQAAQSDPGPWAAFIRD